MRKTEEKHYPSTFYESTRNLENRKLARMRHETFEASPPERPYIFPWDVLEADLRARFLANKANNTR